MRPPDDPPGSLDDARAQFMIAVGDLCVAAEVGNLAIELLTAEGDRIAGVPAWIEPRTRDPGDETGYRRTFRVAGHLVDLGGVVACTILAPAFDPSLRRAPASIAEAEPPPRSRST